ncbi:phage integrase SAM-like domain-containing protein [Roseivirga sp.]|uniref:phage integrase SAM-like domain-containing protein n=1 Tax=Roseivirga sp. TaxID=1964215 RepID=UPI003B8B6CA9
MANNIRGLNINPKVEPRPNKNKEFRWSIRVKYKADSKDFATGSKSNDRGEIPPKVIASIDNVENCLVSAYRQSGLLQEEFDFKSEFDNIKRIINGDKPKDKTASPLVIDLINDKLESIEKDSSSGKLITLKNHLEAFRPSIRAEEITPKFKIDFLRYLEQYRLQSTSLRQLFAQLSGTLSFAFNNGKLPHNKYPFLRIKADKGNEEKQYFTRGEYFLFNYIMRYCCESLTKKNSLPFGLSTSNFEALSHLYLACLTGLRHSDLKALGGRPLIIQSESNKNFLVVGTSKTSKTLKIPLSKNAVWFIRFKKVIEPLSSEYYALRSGLEKINKASTIRHFKPTDKTLGNDTIFSFKLNPNASISPQNSPEWFDLEVIGNEIDRHQKLKERIEKIKSKPLTDWQRFLEYFNSKIAGGKGNKSGTRKEYENWIESEEGKNWALAYEESLNYQGFLSRQVYQTKVYTNTDNNETLAFPYWQKCSYHDGRRFFGSIYYHKTKDINLVQKLLGHTTPAETSGYIVRWEEEKEEVNPLDIV